MYRRPLSVQTAGYFLFLCEFHWTARYFHLHVCMERKRVQLRVLGEIPDFLWLASVKWISCMINETRERFRAYPGFWVRDSWINISLSDTFWQKYVYSVVRRSQVLAGYCQNQFINNPDMSALKPNDRTSCSIRKCQMHLIINFYQMRYAMRVSDISVVFLLSSPFFLFTCGVG